VRRAQRAQAAGVGVSHDVVIPIGLKLSGALTDPALFLSSADLLQCVAGEAPAPGALPGGGIFIAPGLIIIEPGPGRSRLV